MTQPHPDEKRHGVYTTMQPDVRVEVSTAERDELAAQGLLAREEGTTEPPEPASEARARRERAASGASATGPTAGADRFA